MKRNSRTNRTCHQTVSQFDDKGKQGKAGKMNIAEQTSELWMKNIIVSPADLMARKFAIEAQQVKP